MQTSQKEILEVALVESQRQEFMNVLPHALANAYFKLPRDYHLMEEARIIREFQPSSMWHRLRIAFWDEYHRARDRGVRMLPQNIIRGNCTHDYWKEYILPNEKAVAFITHPIPEYALQNTEMLMLSMKRMREILEAPLFAKNGQVNRDILKAIMKMYEVLDRRVHGMPTHKIQIDQRNLNVNTTLNQSHGHQSLEELEAEVKRLEEENKKIVNGRNLLDAPREILVFSEGDKDVNTANTGGEISQGEIQAQAHRGSSS